MHDEEEQRRRLHHEADVVIVGAGIMGCTLAVALAQQGRSVLLLERSLKEPDRIVGEYLQPGGIQALEKLGMGECLEDIDAMKSYGYHVLFFDEAVDASYPQQPSSPELVGRAFHHGRFVQRLREKARSTKNVTIVETTVNEMVTAECNGQVLGVEATTNGQKDCYFADLTVIADGHASKFRKQLTTRLPESNSKFWALELIDAELPRPQYANVVLSDVPPTMFYRIGTREIRALIDVPNGLDSCSPANGGIKNHLRTVVLPTLPESIQPAFEAAIDKDRLRHMPNAWLPPSLNKRPGAILLGDAMNMRCPITGGGMSVAINDAVLLSEVLAPSIIPRLDDTEKIRKQMGEFHWRRKNLSSIVNILAQGAYALFAPNDPNLKALQLGVVRYFQSGPNCVDPCALLFGCVLAKPLVLFYHCFSVALLSMWIYTTSSGLLAIPYRAISSLAILWRIGSLMFPYIRSEIQT